MSKEIERCTYLDNELKKTRIDLEESQNLINKLNDENSNSIVHESMLRRLDNERNYLKNQLDSQICEKNEILEKLGATEKQLNQLKISSKSELDKNKCRVEEQITKIQSENTELRETNQILEAEMSAQRSQLDEVKEAYSQIRDNLRLEQASSQQMRAASHRIAEEFKAAQDELSHTKQLATLTDSRYNDTMAVLKKSITEIEASKEEEIASIKKELEIALKDTSIVQTQMIQMQRKLEYITRNNNLIQGIYLLIKMMTRKEIFSKVIRN